LGIWPLEGGEFNPIPGLESNYAAIGWTPDGESVYVAPIRRDITYSKVSRVNIKTGKMETWRTFGEETGAGVYAVAPPHLSSDGTAYAYLYWRVLSESYVVNGLK
jgi:hypothetical protein